MAAFLVNSENVAAFLLQALLDAVKRLGRIPQSRVARDQQQRSPSLPFPLEIGARPVHR
jgi:hypothetical protein